MVFLVPFGIGEADSPAGNHHRLSTSSSPEVHGLSADGSESISLQAPNQQYYQPFYGSPFLNHIMPIHGSAGLCSLPWDSQQNAFGGRVLGGNPSMSPHSSEFSYGSYVQQGPLAFDHSTSVTTAFFSPNLEAGACSSEIPEMEPNSYMEDTMNDALLPLDIYPLDAYPFIQTHRDDGLSTTNIEQPAILPLSYISTAMIPATGETMMWVPDEQHFSGENGNEFSLGIDSILNVENSSDAPSQYQNGTETAGHLANSSIEEYYAANELTASHKRYHDGSTKAVRSLGRVTLPRAHRGGRKGPLSVREREERREAKIRGVCIRCRRTKIKVRRQLRMHKNRADSYSVLAAFHAVHVLRIQKPLFGIYPCVKAQFLDLVKNGSYFSGL